MAVAAAGSLAMGSTGLTVGRAAGDVRHLSAASQEILRAADAAQLDLSARLALLQDTEKQALCSALVEERSRFCLFVACLKPVMVGGRCFRFCCCCCCLLFSIPFRFTLGLHNCVVCSQWCHLA